MSKLWCAGITSNQEENIRDLIESTKDYVDGFCWTVHTDSKDKTFDLLNENKKEGKIVQVPYIKHHGISAMFWMHCGVIRNGHWVIINDSKEKLQNFWLSKIREDIKDYEQQGVGAVYCSGRPFLFQFYDFMTMDATPHWFLNHPVGQIITISEENKDKYIINKRKLDPTEHFCLHDIRYLWEFGVSNQIPAFYSKYGSQVVNFHETERVRFRLRCEKEMGLEFTLKSLEDYLKSTRNYPEWFIDYVESEFSLSEFFRLKVLGEDFMKDLVPRRELWSFKNYLQFGSGFSDPNYLGTRPKYDRMILENNK